VKYVPVVSVIVSTALRSVRPKNINLGSRLSNIEEEETYKLSDINRFPNKSLNTYGQNMKREDIRTFLAGAILAAPPLTGATSETILSKSLLIISPYARNCALSLCSTRVCRKKKMLTLSLRVVAGNSSRMQEYKSSWRDLCFRAN
jgi:hypothetical protein